MIIKTLGYCRVSTAEQAAEGISLAAQAEKIEQYCQLNDLELQEIIEDPGESGKDLNRPGMKKLREMVGAKAVDAVVVYKLDRLSRNVLDTLAMIGALEKNKVAFHSITEKIDTKTAMGKFFLNITASFAQMERDLIAERTRDALQFKKSSGELVGSVPYGKRLAADGVHLQDDPGEAETVSLAKRLRSRGRSLGSIARELTSRGCVCRGAKWHSQTVKNIVHNGFEGVSAVNCRTPLDKKRGQYCAQHHGPEGDVLLVKDREKSSLKPLPHSGDGLDGMGKDGTNEQ